MAKIWKNTHCSGRNVDGSYLADFKTKTNIPYCREQPGEEDAAAISNCVEKCGEIRTCNGFTFSRGTDNTNRCCFRADTSEKKHGISEFACFEKVKIAMKPESSEYAE